MEVAVENDVIPGPRPGISRVVGDERSPRLSPLPSHGNRVAVTGNGYGVVLPSLSVSGGWSRNYGPGAPTILRPPDSSDLAVVCVRPNRIHRRQILQAGRHRRSSDEEEETPGPRVDTRRVQNQAFAGPSAPEDDLAGCRVSGIGRGCDDSGLVVSIRRTQCETRKRGS